MNNTATLSHRGATPVTVGDTVVFCENFKASAVKSINEEITVNGKGVITSTGIRALRLTFSGRIYDETAPLKFLADMNSEMEGQSFTVSYRGLTFTDCILQRYEVTDNGRDWAEASFTLVTMSGVTEDQD